LTNDSGKWRLTINGHMLILVQQSVTLMPRPKCCRRIGSLPDVNYYKPRGVSCSLLEEVNISLDEFESIRLADFEGLYQDAAAVRMNISRQTFGRIIVSAHRKIADALLHGRALKIEGGSVEMNERKANRCKKCDRRFTSAEVHPKKCPQCSRAQLGS